MERFSERFTLKRTRFDVMLDRHGLVLVNVVFQQLLGLPFLGLGVHRFLIVVDALGVLLGCSWWVWHDDCSGRWMVFFATF